MSRTECQESKVLKKARSVLRFAFVLLLLFTAASQFSVSMAIAEIGEDEADLALASADGAVVSAYHSVLEAEEAGANVSDLLVRLNESGLFLTQARIAYWMDDFDETVNFAASSRSIGIKVQDEAVRLKSAALIERVQLIILTVAVSGVSISLIASGSFWVWRALGRRYGQSAALSKRIGDKAFDEC